MESINAPQTIEIASYAKEDINDFCELIHDYSIRLSELEDCHNRIYSKLEDCSKFMNNIQVPYNFEYLKLLYIHAFDNFTSILAKIRMDMEEIPQIVESACLCALATQAHDKKSNCQYHLDMLFTTFSVSLSNLEKDVDTCIKNGCKAFDASKKINSRCI
jgi:hypothetical protein